MGLIDVTDVVTDPDFQDVATLLSGSETVGADGFNAISRSGNQTFLGVFQPASGNDVRLLPEGVRAEGAIVVYTMQRLVGAYPGRAPDRVVWEGATYQVSVVEPWNNWGAGYVRAILVLIDYAQPVGDILS